MSESEALAACLERQQQLHPRSIELGLGRVRRVAEALGLLPVRVPAVIVAGTNGKGSTSAYLAALLQATGRSCGLFTSPHLRHYAERIAVDGRPASDGELLQAFAAIDAARAATTLTFFEYNALAALWQFRARGVAAMVLEVGLGGRLDATNIVDADVAVLTSVALDHTDWLGPTRASIGREKAGVFRAGRPVVLGDADMPETVYVRARELRCPVRVAERNFDWVTEPDGRWHYRDEQGQLRWLRPPGLGGAIQYRNAATALAAARCLLPAPEAAALRDPAQAGAAVAAVTLPGRLQVVPGEVEWLLDVAHNPAAVEVLAQALSERPPARRTLAILGMLADKDVATVAATLVPRVDEWLLASTGGERGLSAAALAARIGPLRGAVSHHADVAAAVRAAQSRAAPGDRVLVLGSFQIVGPALDLLRL